MFRILVVEKSPCSGKVWEVIRTGLSVEARSANTPEQVEAVINSGFEVVVICEDAMADPNMASAVEKLMASGGLVLLEMKKLQ